jgi:putative tricarboxylic transport membrane protein
MEALGYLVHGFVTAGTLQNLLLCFMGVIYGMFVGILPGLGPTAGTALLLPLSYGLSPVSAIILLSGIYYGAMYGGTITSVLINTPGESASLITCLDGYPMAKQGRAGAALGVAAIGSFIGGMIALAVLIILGPLVAEQALKFGPAEYFSLVIVGLSLLIGMMGKSLVRGLIASLFGLTLAFVGIDQVSGHIRFAFGEENLEDGIEFVSLAMGMFGLSEILLTAEENMNAQKQDFPKIQSMFPKREEWMPTLRSILRGSGIGVALGLIPGTNAVIPTILSYSIEKKIAKDPSRFGKGAIEGVAGPETANNAYAGAALIPLFTLGIPTSPAIAVLLGAFIMHGLTPGPTLLQKNPEFVWGVIASMFIGNAILIIMNLPLANMWARITRIPFKILLPIIMIIMILGSYSLNNKLFDVGSMLLFGILGYFMKKANFPLGPVLLTFVLGKILENSLMKALTIFGGDIWQFFLRPISGTLLVIAITIMAVSIYFGIKNKGIVSDSEI